MSAEDVAAVVTRLLRALAELQRLQAQRLRRLADHAVELERAAARRARDGGAR